MKHRSVVLTAASALAWAALLIARGAFWRARVDAHAVAYAPARATGRRDRVEAIVPARDEAETIARALASLAGQRFDGELHVTLVDDASGDGTAACARRAAPGVAIVPGRALRTGWTGKVNALQSGVDAVRALRGEPTYWFFTDADIEHDARNVAELVAKAERDGLDLVSLMVRLRCESGWERLLMPAFVFFFAKLYPFAWSNDPAHATAAAAGGCMLVRASALERIGGLRAIASALIDDCALARCIKGSGGRTWLGLGARTTSVRRYESLPGIWSMIKRSAFVQLGRSYPLLVVTVGAMLVLYVVPPLATIAGLVRRDTRLTSVGAGVWVAMAVAYLPTLRAYGRPALEAIALPFAAALYTLMTVDSAIADGLGRGGAWKGRTYAKAA